MADCEWAILCDYAFLDVGRKMCLIGAFDRVTAASVPAAHPVAAFAFKVVGEPGEAVKFKVELHRPSGGTLVDVAGDSMLGERGTVEVQFNLAPLPLPDFGIYTFHVTLDGESKKATQFEVVQPTKGPSQ